MELSKWLNQRQPQYLQNATLFLYVRAVFGLLGVRGGGILFLLSLAGIPAGYGIANEKKWGYYLALVVAVVPLALSVLLAFDLLPGFAGGIGTNLIITIIFQIVLVVFLVHPMSRDYQRIWFK